MKLNEEEIELFQNLVMYRQFFTVFFCYFSFISLIVLFGLFIIDIMLEWKNLACWILIWFICFFFMEYVRKKENQIKAEILARCE
ncbi:MAG: hypothetical protein [Siphoviridae sp. ctjeG17]|nr:MAG: hypothetical protein [Siphoviridae sp. ctjeG17]